MNTFTIGCITSYGMAVHKPRLIEIAVSGDNKTFDKAGERTFTPEEIFREGNYIEDISISLGGVETRYIRVTAKGIGKCPDNHVRPGQEARVHFDEVMIE